MASHPRVRPAAWQRGGIFFRLLFLIFFLCLLFLVYLARHPLLRMAGSFWIVDEAPLASDAIVVLGDDNYNGDRATRAAELLKAGWAPRIVASGRGLRSYASIAELEEHDLTDRGVPVSAIVRFAHRGENTREEAIAVGQLVSSHGWKRIILVTSNFHTRRARYIYERSLAPGTVLRVVAARDSDFDPDNWWNTRTGIKIFAHELVGMVVALWEMRHNSVETSENARHGLRPVIVADLDVSSTLHVYSELRLYYSLTTAEDCCRPPQRPNS
jgi:vancomycin permeability regulator SanA